MSYVRIPAISQTPISLFNATTITAATSGSNVTYYQYQNSQTGDTTSVMGHDVVGVSIDEFCDENTGDFHERRVRIRCPHCAYPNYPFRKRERPKCLETGEEWVGIDYKQPYAHYSSGFASAKKTAPVGGHWRNQWYPSLGIHRQIYISEHVKGPEHLPLAVRKGRVWNFVQ